MELTTFLFWQALLPFEFQLSTGLLPPRPAARWFFFGGLMHSCGGVWALSLPLPFGLGLLGSCLLAFFLCMFCLSLSIRIVGSTGAFVGSVLFPQRICAAMGQGAWSFPRSVFSLGRSRVLPLPSVFCGWRIPFGAASLEVVSRAVDSALCCCPRTFNLSSPAFFSGALFCPPLLPWNLVVLWCLLVALGAFVFFYS